MKRRWILFAALLACALLQPQQAHCQQLTVQTAEGKQTVLSKADIEALPRVKMNASAHGESATFEGPLLRSVLEKGGVALGETLRGKKMASCLLVEAADGYRVVIALPELDPGFTDKRVVLAFLKNGKPLDEKEGPYRVVIPDEKRPVRWVRQVTTLKVVEVK
jgi:hypothetical protein